MQRRRNVAKPIIRRYNMTDQVYNLLRSQILRGVFFPGAEILVDKIAEELNVSKTPVREAMSKLKGERLVVGKDKGKVYVTKLSAEEVVQISDLYAALQTLALEWGFEHISREEIQNNLKMLQEAKKNLDRGDIRTFLKVDVILHDIITSSAGNEWLVRVTSQVGGLIAIIRNTFTTLERYKEAWQDHIVIVESILKGDKDAVIKSLNSHIEHVKLSLLASLRQQSGE